eukprot:1947199-Pyramimonas_sp.AAC.1
MQALATAAGKIYRVCLARGLTPNAGETKAMTCFGGHRYVGLRPARFELALPGLKSEELGAAIEVVRNYECPGAMAQDGGGFESE